MKDEIEFKIQEAYEEYCENWSTYGWTAKETSAHCHGFVDALYAVGLITLEECREQYKAIREMCCIGEFSNNAQQEA